MTFAERAPNAADYPGAKPELLVPASVVFQQAGPACRPAQIVITGGPTFQAPTGGIREGRPARSKGSAKHPVVHVAFEDVEATPIGSAKSCRPKPNGSSPRAADWTGAEFGWGDEFTPGGNRWPTPGKASFPGRI